MRHFIKKKVLYITLKFITDADYHLLAHLTELTLMTSVQFLRLWTGSVLILNRLRGLKFKDFPRSELLEYMYIVNPQSANVLLATQKGQFNIFLMKFIGIFLIFT